MEYNIEDAMDVDTEVVESNVYHTLSQRPGANLSSIWQAIPSSFPNLKEKPAIKICPAIFTGRSDDNVDSQWRPSCFPRPGIIYTAQSAESVSPVSPVHPRDFSTSPTSAGGSGCGDTFSSPPHSPTRPIGSPFGSGIRSPKQPKFNFFSPKKAYLNDSDVQSQINPLAYNSDKCAEQADIRPHTFPFSVHGAMGNIEVAVQPNLDKDHAWGLDIADPTVKKAQMKNNFRHYPVLTATLYYPIPGDSTAGWRSLLGWIQFIKVEDRQQGQVGEWMIQTYPFAQGINTPFMFWGYKPTLFCTPHLSPAMREDEKDEGIVWKAQNFLCVLEGGGMEKKVSTIEGAAFEWGFDVKMIERPTIFGAPSTGRVKLCRRTEHHDVVALKNVGAVWNSRLKMLRGEYPGWEFCMSQA